MTKQRIGIVLVGILIIVSVIGTLKHIKRSPVSTKNGTSSLILPSSIDLKVYKLETNNWGYDILIDNKTFIFQHKIPGIPGNKVFKTQADAMHCGELVIQKIKNKQVPSVTTRELDSLKIDY